MPTFWPLEENGQEWGYCTVKRWTVNLADWGWLWFTFSSLPPLQEREPIWRFAQACRMDALRRMHDGEKKRGAFKMG